MSGEPPILVAGCAGQLARCLAEAAVRNGVRLVALGRPNLDISDAGSIARTVAAIRPSLIVNAAAYTAVDKAESEPLRAFAINRDGPARLAAAAEAARIPFIHISTDYVFDGRKPTPYCEDDPTAPLGIYGLSKLEGEAAVVEACPSVLVLRTSWVYSPYGQNFVTTMLRLAETRTKVRVVADQHGAPTAAADIAAAVLALAPELLTGRGSGGLYHLAAEGSTTWHGFAAAIFAGWRARGRPVPDLEPIATAEYPTPAKRPANSQLDCSRIARDFGIRLPPWQQSLAACLDALAAAPAEASPC
ncbi:MAG: dTDP-4-dehydrorhamnose reductase [Hyphomicrobiaceae bacterium]|nr:dTDP-4-dehydrorhamnose reductase [Hyphomicrobiaceae bacterium]